MPTAPRKRFGQNFLVDQGIINDIIALVNPIPGQCLVEIGPGRGALTKPLLQVIDQLNAIEIDRDLIDELKSLKGLAIYESDVLKFDFSQLINNGIPLRIIGNLPYNISTPLLLKLMPLCDHIQDMYFMLQKEVVERLSATTDHKNYGRLSVIVQYFCQVENLLAVPPDAFFPPPKVNSAIVGLTPRANRIKLNYGITSLETVTRTAFNQRRKTISNSLGQLFNRQQLQTLGFDPSLRAENLSVEDYVNLANNLNTK